MIQKFPKQSYDGLCDGESPLKDVTVLQQLGDGDLGILECTEAPEDERYIYVICEIDRTLGETSIPAPAQQKHNKSTTEAQQKHTKAQQKHNKNAMDRKRSKSSHGFKS